jgi:hypothetical protein
LSDATAFRVSIERLADDTLRFRFSDREDHARPLTWAEVLGGWRDPAWVRDFASQLAASPWPAFFWETPPLMATGLDTAFECVTVSAPRLASKGADISAFADLLSGSGSDIGIASFPNLGGDARLVVPQQVGREVDYGHLAAFLRTAGADQIESLWAMVSEAASLELSKGRPIWTSTSGLGVPWLHVRIDTRPKYYSYAPYRAVGGSVSEATR